MNKYLFGSLSLFLLFGCSLGGDQKGSSIPPNPPISVPQTGGNEGVENSHAIDHSSTGDTTEVNPSTNENEQKSQSSQGSSNTGILSSQDGSGVLMSRPGNTGDTGNTGNSENTGNNGNAGDTGNNENTKSTLTPTFSSGQLFERIVQKVNNIQTLQELDEYLPSAKGLEGRENPKFIDFQKKKILLGLYISEISHPEYIKAVSRVNDIITAKEIWPTELQSLYSRMETLSGQLATSKNDPALLASFQSAVTDYAKAIKDFHSTPGFTEYVQKHADEVASIQNNEIQKYYSPEIIQLQNQVNALYEKIYVTAPKN